MKSLTEYISASVNEDYAIPQSKKNVYVINGKPAENYKSADEIGKAICAGLKKELEAWYKKETGEKLDFVITHESLRNSEAGAHSVKLVAEGDVKGPVRVLGKKYELKFNTYIYWYMTEDGKYLYPKTISSIMQYSTKFTAHNLGAFYFDLDTFKGRMEL